MASHGQRRVSWWVPAAILVLTAFAFAPAIQNGFTDWDDPGYVTENRLIRDLSPEGVQAIFRAFVEGNYHPLTMVSLAFDYHLWKLDPTGYHVTGLVLHLANTLLVFVFLFLLTGSQELAAITSLFFGIHPMHVESVAWVSGRKDVLYVLFYLASCIAYVLWARGRRPPWVYYAGALGLFVLALLSKGMAVSLPAALLAIDFYLRRKGVKKLLIEKIPFLLIALAFGYAAVVAQTQQGAIQKLATFAFYERVLFACYGIASYFVRAVLPTNLSAIYPYPLRTGGGLPMIYYLAPLAVLAIGAAVFLSLRRGRTVVFGALFFLANVALVLQLFPVGSAVIADRYTYLSYVGVGVILASLVSWLAHGVLGKRVALRTALLILLAGAGVSALFATRARCAVWKDNVTLWTDVLRHSPNLPLAYTKRARTYMQQNRNELALADAERAISLDPNEARALTTRGTIRFLNQDYPGALADLEKAVAIDPREAVPWNSLGAVHLTLGKSDAALSDFSRAIALNPGYAEAYLNRALTLGGMSRVAQAMSDFDASIRLQPGNGKAHFFRSEARYVLGDRSGAVEDAERAQALGFPVDPGYWNKLRGTTGSK